MNRSTSGTASPGARFLELRSLSKRYANGILALDDVSLSIGEGVLGLLGPNGAGKTTLMSILATVTHPTSGTFLLDDHDGVAEPRFVRTQMGYLPQDFGVYEKLTASEFLSYLGRLKGLSGSGLRRAVAGALELTNLHGVADRRLKAFSGGMRQRVGIAQALLGDPKVIIVDEPTAGLDPEERIRFRNLLSEIAHGRIVILSTHVISDLEAIAARIAVVRKGKVMTVATPEELLARAQGRTFSLVTSSDRLADIQGSVRVSGLVRRPDGVHVRFVASAPLLEGAVAVEPTLEDAYLVLDSAMGQA